jgi:hypothetical protein
VVSFFTSPLSSPSSSVLLPRLLSPPSPPLPPPSSILSPSSPPPLLPLISLSSLPCVTCCLGESLELLQDFFVVSRSRGGWSDGKLEGIERRRKREKRLTGEGEEAEEGEEAGERLTGEGAEAEEERRLGRG